MEEVLDVRYNELIKQIEKIADLKFKDKIPADIYDLISELQTNQNGLKIQNEELQTIIDKIQIENNELKLKLLETEETLNAIQSGEVDALVVSSPEGPQIYSLEGSDRAYRTLIEEMNEGAAILMYDGSIFYCNNSLAHMLKVPLEEMVGNSLNGFISSNDLRIYETLLKKSVESNSSEEISLKASDGTHIPAYISMQNLKVEGLEGISVIITDLTEQKRIEDVISSEKLSRYILNQAGDHIIVCDEKGTIIRASDISYELSNSNLVMEKFNKAFNLFDENKEIISIEPVLKGKLIHQTEVFLISDEERVLNFLLNAKPIISPKNKIMGCVIILTDITERKKAEKLTKELLNQTRDFAYKLEVSNEELRTTTDELHAANEELRNQGENLIRLNRTLKALSNSNHAMIHAKEENEYLNEICRIIIEDCGHAMVWIGFAEYDKNKTVLPVAQYGFDEGYIENLNVTWADNKLGRGPTGSAIRTGTPSVCRNMLTDPTFEPWREEAIKRGYASSIVVPLNEKNKTLGAISIYSREPDAFLDEEVKLLAELANDLAFGITNLRLRDAKEKTEKELRESEERYRLILETANSGVLMLDAENRIKYLNQSTIQLLGYPAQEMLDTNIIQFIDIKKQKNVHKFMNGWRKGSNRLNEFRFIRKDGSTFWTLLAASPIIDPKGKYVGVICVITDINARKGVEKALMEREKISKSILYDMMGIINKLMKEEVKKDDSDEYKNKLEYT